MTDATPTPADSVTIDPSQSQLSIRRSGSKIFIDIYEHRFSSSRRSVPLTPDQARAMAHALYQAATDVDHRQ